MRNSNGFTLLETVTAFSVLLVLLLTLFPALISLENGRAALSWEREAVSLLYDEYHLHLKENRPYPYTKVYQIHNPVTLIFTEEGGGKGCAYWKDTKNRENEFCLYDVPPE
ncbi:prepilin-type N-terminal cleavage/methylation domain-containing protein [Halobacillus kuroshimensis]|uniref:Prepilin-type N-terminal cleavage/methylation domain-containing protein n=1 Tax=Halobacillus kuroshimensis TaxID=302481 RepID=A0ABS3DZ32_9BACI|nr:prepilin-type N-terminal cleavage/methylation domain-containing protein [Halobacillus kuroshimensis]MBN8236617.1 prepilin-type N-terminal cleavage/methylation domain-containing protein [Halobacillus kuroshimensis]